MKVERAHAAHFVFPLAMMIVGCSSSDPAPAAVVGDSGAPEASSDVDAGSHPDDAGADVAAPSGDCDAYCGAVQSNCTKIGQGYANTSACMAHCKALPLGVVGDSLDTVGCRQAHAAAAATSVFVECPLAGAFPPSGCGDPCDAFCKLATAACDDSWQGHCMEACAQWPGNEAGASDSTGNTLSCRETYVERALEGDLDDAGGPCVSVVTDSAQCK